MHVKKIENYNQWNKNSVRDTEFSESKSRKILLVVFLRHRLGMNIDILIKDQWDNRGID